jgi:hypothetical protein
VKALMNKLILLLTILFAALLEATMAGSFLMFTDGGDILSQCAGLLYSHSGYLIGEEILL